MDGGDRPLVVPNHIVGSRYHPCGVWSDDEVPFAVRSPTPPVLTPSSRPRPGFLPVTPLVPRQPRSVADRPVDQEEYRHRIE